jgi:hypothetical protein
MAMRSKIPSDIREQLANDPYMDECDVGVDCDGRLEWHHAFTYAGRRRNELWAIIPLCHYHHVNESKARKLIEQRVRDRIAHFHAEATFREKYPRSTLLSG